MNIQQAIDFIRDCRRTHVEWAEWIAANPEKATIPRPEIDVAGDEAHHRECITGYDAVLGFLEPLTDDLV